MNKHIDYYYRMETKIPEQFVDEGLGIEEFLMLKEVVISERCHEEVHENFVTSKYNPYNVETAKNLEKSEYLKYIEPNELISEGGYIPTSKARKSFS